jgi:hypothetical protein
MNEKCYCCNENTISREHIPPKCLFLTPRPSNMITVPSCQKHIFAKSKDDEYFIRVRVRFFDTLQRIKMNKSKKKV